MQQTPDVSCNVMIVIQNWGNQQAKFSNEVPVVIVQIEQLELPNFNDTTCSGVGEATYLFGKIW